MLRTWAVALVSLFLTHAYFFEYRPGVRRVEIPYDLKGFHYPLADYAFQAVREGRLPEWDHTMYCGLPFAANVQAALFYPATWLLFAANAAKTRLSYQTLQDWMFLHVWFGFLLCFVWLQWRKLSLLACVLGACVFALSGFTMIQMQHLGLVAGYCWMPLGFWGIDQSHAENRWRPLWKLVVASACCFLAGYTPFWVVFAVAMTTYAAARMRPWRVLVGAIGALAMSLPVVAVQLFPAVEAGRMMENAARYGPIRDWTFFIPYVIPNFGDYALHVPSEANPGVDYFYLGCAGIAGIVAALVARNIKAGAGGLALVAAGLFFLSDPLRVLTPLLKNPSPFSDVIRSWYFLGAISAGAALLAAVGLDRILRGNGRRMPVWAVAGVCALALAWSARLLWTWKPSGAEFASGWMSAWDAAVGLVLVCGVMWMFRGSSGYVRVVAAVVMVLLVVVEYKAFGTCKRFNASRVGGWAQYPHSPLPTVDESVVKEIRSKAGYRVAVDRETMFTTEMRHAGFSTPQGFDPFLSKEYRTLITKRLQFRTDREFDVSAEDEATLRLFGVRYYITRHDGSMLPYLRSSNRYQAVLPQGEWHKIFELNHADPACGWERGVSGGSFRGIGWTPERRALELSSRSGGVFRLSEQYFPGWTATLNGAPARIERCHEAFQCVQVPAGEHVLEFRYRSTSLRVGAAVSLLSCLLLGLAMWFYSSDFSLFRRTAKSSL